MMTLSVLHVDTEYTNKHWVSLLTGIHCVFNIFLIDLRVISKGNKDKINKSIHVRGPE